MKEISENKIGSVKKKINKHNMPKTKHDGVKEQSVDAIGQTEGIVDEKKLQPTKLPFEMEPFNWDMLNDTMVYLHEDIMYIDEKLVVKNTGFKSPQNEPIGESETEEVLVKSNVKFGTIVHPGKNTNFVSGDTVALNIQAVKVLDFSKNFAVAPHFAIYGKIRTTAQHAASEPTGRKNIFGRILQGLAKRLGFRNVHKQQ